MSGTQVSGFADPNILYKSLSGLGTAEVQRNQLLNQAEQQNITDHDIAMTGQAAAPLLNLNEDQAAAAYPAWLQDMQSRGLAKYAPATYPGHAATQALVQRAMPILQQIESGFLTPPGSADARKNINDIYTRSGTPPAPTSTSGGTGGAGAPSVPAYGGGTGNLPVPAEYMPYFQEASQRTGIPVDLLIAQSRQESGFNPGATGAAGEVGLMQIHPKTAASPGFGMAGVQNPDVLRDPRTNINFGADYLAARAKAIGADLTTPQGQAAALHAYNGGGDPNYVANVFRYVPPGGPAVATAGAPGSTTAARQPVVTGDSLASPAGLGGSGVVGDSPAKVLARVQAESRAGKYDGQPVVLSTGASNNPTDLASVEQQIREAQSGNAGKITVLGVGPAVEAKAPGTNAKLQALAKSYGAQFVPLPADQMSPDGIHPTPQGYATLKGAIAPPQGAPGGVAARTGGTNVAGPGAGPGGAPGQPAAMPRDQAVAQAQRTGQAVPVAGVDGLWALPNGNLSSTPPAPAQPAPAVTPQPQAQMPQPPPNRVMPGSPDGPPAAAQPAAPAPAQPPPSAPRANLPRAADVPQGLNSPQIQQAQRLQQAASQIEMQAAQNPFDKRLQAEAAAKAADLKQRAQILMQTDTVVQTQDGPLHVATGVIDKPIPHYVYDPTQHAYVDTTGTNKPEFEPAQRDSAVAQRDVMELGPKVANGSATPQEQARYATAVETYRQPKVMTDPISKQLIRVNERELPSGFPEPGGSGAAGGGPQPITQGLSPAQQQVERDPAAYKVSETQYTNDAQDVRPLAEAGRQAQADQVRIKEMQDVLQRFSTGSGTEARTAAAAFLQRWLPASITGWEKESANLSGAEAAQAFSKLALVGAGTQERGVLGARGGYQAIKLFKDANPSINLQDATNKSILDMQLISNQANQDYTQAALSHFADNEKKFQQTHQYDSLTQFDRNWNAQRNPQVYAAAMGAISGQAAAQWTKGLSEDEYTRALQIVQRAKPSAVVQTKNGPYSMQPSAVTTGTSGTPGNKVIRFDHNGNVIP